MGIYAYRTGEFLRPATEEEAARYMVMIAHDTSGSGAVSGESFGYDFTIYMV
jgi:hypothetical protein